MSFLADRSQAGFVPRQDHRKGVPVGRRLGPAGVRVIDPKGDDDPEAGFVFEEGSGGSIGDEPAWRWWKADKRDCGAWGVALLARVTEASEATEDAKGRPITGGGSITTGVLPVRKSDYTTDGAFKTASHSLPEWLGPWPKGTVVIGMAGTREDGQEDVLAHADPRIVVVNKNPYDQMGTTFNDLDPTGTISTTRAARSQTHLRVAHIGGNADRLGVIGVSEAHWAAAWQHATTGQGSQAGLGAVYCRLVTTDTGLGTGGPAITPSDPTPRPGGGPPVSPGTGPGASPGSPGNASPGGAVPPGAQGGRGGAGGGGTGPAGTASKATTARGKPGIAFYARDAWGPLHGGDEHDQHQYCVNDDGEPINSGHLDVDRHLWFRDKQHDAPLEFDRRPWGPVHAPMKVFAYIRYDLLSDHEWALGKRRGLWRLEAESFFTQKNPPPTSPPTTGEPDDPPPPTRVPPPITPPSEPNDPPQPAPPPSPPTTPTEPPTTVTPPGQSTPPPVDPYPDSAPGRSGGVLPGPFPRHASEVLPGTGGGSFGNAISRLGQGHRYVQRADRASPTPEGVAYSPQQIGAPGMLLFPQHLSRPGAVDLRYSQTPPEAEWKAAVKTTPAVARVESFAAEAGETFSYTQRPGKSRVPGGTASGIALVMPPEVDGKDVVDSFAPTGLTRSTSYFGWAPGAYAGWGVPERNSLGAHTGDLANGGYRAGWTNSAIKFERRTAGTWTSALEMNSTGVVSIAGSLIVTGAARFKKTVTTTTAAVPGTVTVTAATSGTSYNNSGSAAAVTYNLPTAVGNDGAWYTFLVQAAQNMVIQLQAGEILTVENAATTPGGTATANQIGAFLVIEAANGGWLATSYSLTHAWTLA